VTTPNKFYINPNVGMLKPGVEAKISLAIHREVLA
jgi:hypothetical protein